MMNELTVRFGIPENWIVPIKFRTLGGERLTANCTFALLFRHEGELHILAVTRAAALIELEPFHDISPGVVKKGGISSGQLDQFRPNAIEQLARPA
jgi:hypothetical protein